MGKEKIAVTGAAGFLGQQFCKSYGDRYDIVGVDFGSVAPVDGIEWHSLKDAEELPLFFEENTHDCVVHMAFVNRKPENCSVESYIRQMTFVNSELFSVLARKNQKLLLVSSSAVYGAKSDCPIDEKSELSPVSLYGFAKLLQENLANYYSTCGMNLVIARLFNLAGPGQKLGMLLPDWVNKVKQIQKGAADHMSIPHMTTGRDFVDVRDASDALSMLIDDFAAGEVFNISSDISVPLKDVFCELENICNQSIAVIENKKNLISSDVAYQRGCSKKMRQRYQWAPKFGWKQSLKDLWDSF